MRYRVTRDAAGELDEIFSYWAKRVSVETAERVINGIIKHFPLIADYPDTGRSTDNITPGVRCFPAGKYLIYFRKTNDGIQILHIIHGARNQLTAFHAPKGQEYE